LKVMDNLVKQQEKIIRAVCDRFGTELSFISFRDDIFTHPEINPASELFTEAILPRLKQLVAPAKEHDLMVALDSPGNIASALPSLYEAGFNIIQSIDPELNPLSDLKKQWQGKLAFVGGISTSLLINGSQEEVEERVRVTCENLAAGGGFVLGTSAGISENIPPQHFAAMIKTAHQYGRYKTFE
jgi:uroporphyrinogen decarboxylase